MVNFVVDPAPFVLEGLEIEDWVHPPHGRIVINGNPPRCHDEYAIVSLVPPPRRINSMMLWKKSWHFWNTSRDVVINDVTLTSLKTPEWSQLVFCDDFVTNLFWSLWWRHICSSVTKLVFPS
jgi:hypothetical protein